MFKLGMALVFGVIAALASGLAGLLTDVRFSTIFLRGLVAFLIAGLCSYLLTFLLEANNLVGYDKNIELMPNEEELAARRAAGEEEESPAEDEEEGFEEEEAAENSFQPFSADNLNRIEPPSAN